MTVEEKRANACTLCPLLPTKPTPTSRDDQEFLDEVERLVRLRDSRDPRFEALKLSTLARDCIVLWDAEVARRERQAKTKAGQMYELLTAFFAPKG